MLPTTAKAPYLPNPLVVALARCQAPTAGPQPGKVGLLHLVQACIIAGRLHGTSAAVKCAAYRILPRLTEEHRHTAALIINSADALDLVFKFEADFME